MNWMVIARYIAYGVLLGTYGVFAWFGKAPVDVFLALVTSALTALGTTHVIGLAAGGDSSPQPSTQPENPK